MEQNFLIINDIIIIIITVIIIKLWIKNNSR